MGLQARQVVKLFLQPPTLQAVTSDDDLQCVLYEMTSHIRIVSHLDLRCVCGYVMNIMGQ